MESPRGFVVIPQCVNIALVKRLAAEFGADIHRRKPTVCRDKYNEYEVSPLGTEVKNDFVKVIFVQLRYILANKKEERRQGIAQATVLSKCRSL